MITCETVKVERKEITVNDVKEMLDNGAKLAAELFETGIIDDDNCPVKEYKAVVSYQNEEGSKTKIVMNMINFLELVELYRRK